MSFQGRRFKKKPLYSWLSLVLVFAALVFMGRVSLKTYLESREVGNVYKEAKEERMEILAKKSELENKLDYLSNAYGLEHELRKQFDLVKPDEELVIILERPEDGYLQNNKSDSSFSERLKEFLGGLFKIQ